MANLSEIERLKSEFSWSDLAPNSEGVRLPQSPSGAEISFPDDSWDDQALNDEGMGVWGDVRLREVHQLMLKHRLHAIWEIGAGNGAVCIGLSGLGHEVVALEPIYSGAKYIASQGISSYGTTLEELNLPKNSIPAIGVFDVLEHIEDPGPMLREFARVLQEDGSLLITVPAHQFLFSQYDSSIGHFRRYSKGGLRDSLEASGFELVESKYLFSFLVPLAWLLRVLPEKMGMTSSATTRKGERAQFRIAQLLSPIFRMLVYVEKLIRLPFGLSIIAVARPKRS